MSITEVRDNEGVYDEQIVPLMQQVIAICKEHGIPMFASFVYAPGNFCTTNIPGPKSDESSLTLQRACAVVTRGRGSSVALTVTTKPVTP